MGGNRPGGGGGGQSWLGLSLLPLLSKYSKKNCMTVSYVAACIPALSLLIYVYRAKIPIFDNLRGNPAQGGIKYFTLWEPILSSKNFAQNIGSQMPQRVSKIAVIWVLNMWFNKSIFS